MLESNEEIANSRLNLQAQHWPTAVGWLAVIAHVAVAIALWQSPKPEPYPGGHHGAITATFLLAEVNLLTIWLLLGVAPWPRRVAWTACGWSCIAFVLSSGERFASTNYFAFAVQPAVTAFAVGYLRWQGFTLKLDRHDETAASARPADRRQFSILELLGATLGAAIAAALITGISDANSFRLHRFRDELQTLLVVSLPAAIAALAAAVGLRWANLLLSEVIICGTLFLLAIVFRTNQQWQWDELLMVHAAHWFLVAATLCVFQMCGYRLGRKRSLKSEENAP